MTLVAVAAAVLIGLLVNEMSDVSPWLARRLAGWSARVRYAGTERAAIRAEELAALVNQRPGKLLKLGTASGFALSSVAHRFRQRLTGREDPAPLLSLDEMNRMLPREEEASRLVARYLFPTERYRGEWRRHVLYPLKAVGYGVAAGTVVWYVGEVRLPLEPYGLPVSELVVAASPFQIALVVLAWSLWRVARWWFDRFSLTNKRLMVVRGVMLRRVAMAPLTSAADLTYRQLLLGRLFNYGTFTLRSVGVLHPMRRLRYLPNPNELYLRAIEEMYEPGAVEARIGLPLRRDATGGENGLDLRGLEELFPPPKGEPATEQPLPRDEVHKGVARLLAAAIGTNVWPLVRDTVAAVMENGRLGVTGQLDTEAHQVAAAKEPEQDEIRRTVVAAWQDRLDNLCGAHLTMQLEEVARRLRKCLSPTAAAWADAVADVDPSTTGADGSAEERVPDAEASDTPAAQRIADDRTVPAPGW